MQDRVGDDAEGPFPGENEDAEEKVDDLEDGDGLDGAVEVLGREVPEDLGPEEAVNGGEDLIWEGRGQHGFRDGQSGCDRHTDCRR